MNNFSSAALAVAIASFGTAAAAQGDPRGAAKVVDDLAACRSIAAPEQRLACFDRAADALVSARQSREIVVLDRQEVKKTERSLFGFSLPKLPFFGGGGEGGKANEPRVDEIESTIAGISPAGYGKYSFRLADGSIWQMIEMDTNMKPRAGDKIRIERAALGSFRASIKGGPLRRVRRTG